MITERQENILSGIVKEYINTARPISSELLEERGEFGLSPATIRNEMKKLSEMGYLEQPHTSAGRIPTDKAYRLFADELFRSSFIAKEIETAKRRIEEELELAKAFEDSLMEMHSVFLSEESSICDILSILGPSKTIHSKNIDVINSLIKELEQF